ncbi:UNVERIFIED_CONTAM: hypothetical protein RMT77_004720 [Armadillidium vulgare]
MFYLNRTAFAVLIFLFSKNASSTVFNYVGKECPIIKAMHEISEKISSAQMKISPEENVVLSPLSIGTFLNLFYLGTSGDTKTEIKKAFVYPEEVEEHKIHDKYKRFISSFENDVKDVKISFNTRLFLQKELSILDSFKNISETSYNTKVEKVDFKGSPNVAKYRINSWVSKTTEGKINVVISEALRKDTKLIAVNTVFFNGSWEYPFYHKYTKDGLFWTGKENITIPMMETIAEAHYFNDTQLKFEIISLPYKGNRFSMIILKPNCKKDLDHFKKIESILETNDLRTIIKKMNSTKIHVIMPKMKIDSEIQLRDNLKLLGINKIFSTDANFDELTTEPGIFVSNILHKALIEITEKGTVGAAATAAVMSKSFHHSKFELNTPALLIIRDKEIGINLFTARLVKPQQLK